MIGCPWVRLAGKLDSGKKKEKNLTAILSLHTPPDQPISKEFSGNVRSKYCLSTADKHASEMSACVKCWLLGPVLDLQRKQLGTLSFTKGPGSLRASELPESLRYTSTWSRMPPLCEEELKPQILVSSGKWGIVGSFPNRGSCDPATPLGLLISYCQYRAYLVGLALCCGQVASVRKPVPCPRTGSSGPNLQ